MKKHIIYLLVLILALPACNTKPQTDEEWQQWREAELLKAEKDVKQYPKNALCYNNLSYILNHLERYEEALQNAEKAIQLDHTLASAHINMGDALESLERYNEAISSYQKAYSLDSYDNTLLNNWGYALSSMGKDEEAIEKFKEAVSIAPTSSIASSNWANALYNLGRYEEAIEKVQFALQGKYPEDSQSSYEYVHLQYGDALEALDKDEEAIEQYNKALSISPNYDLALFKLGYIYEKLEEDSLATQYYSKTIAIDSSFTLAYLNLGYIYHNQLQEYDKAENIYRLLLRHQPDNARGYNNLADAIEKLGRGEEALKMYAEAEKIDSSEVIYNNWGYTLSKLGRYDEAIEKYKIDIHRDETSDTARSNWALALAQLGKYQEAIIKHQEAVDKERSYTSFYSWSKTLESIKEAKSPLYTNARKQFAKALNANKGLRELQDDPDYQAMVEEYTK